MAGNRLPKRLRSGYETRLLLYSRTTIRRMLRYEMERKHNPQDISWFLDIYDKGQLDLDPPYQRRSVWSRTDKQYFIDTVLSNLPAPPIFLHKSLDDQGRPTYHVVDGKQRLQTVIDFTRDKIRIADDFADANFRKKR